MKNKYLTTLATGLLLNIFLSSSLSAQVISADVQVQAEDPYMWIDYDVDRGGSNISDRDWYIMVGINSYSLHYLHYQNLLQPTMAFFGTNTMNSLLVGSSGDVNLADGSVFIDRSANRMGIGTTTPIFELDAVGTVASNALLVKGASPMIQGWLTPDYYALATVGTDTNPRFPFAINRESKTNLIVDVGGVIVGWAGSNTVGDGARQLLALSADNTAAGKTSDAGFSMENVVDGFTWTFRTYSPAEGFAASKIGTGGPEFEVANTTTDNHNAVVKMGGVTVFTGGHLVTASSRTLKTDIKPLDTQAALDAFHQLQPVSFAYKAHHGEPVVGFIAEDMPELVAMPSRKSFDSAEVVAVLTSVLAETRAEAGVAREMMAEQSKVLAKTWAEAKAKDAEIVAMKADAEVMKAKIVKLETMQKKVAMMESILTNLALKTSDTDKSKVSINLK